MPETKLDYYILKEARQHPRWKKEFENLQIHTTEFMENGLTEILQEVPDSQRRGRSLQDLIDALKDKLYQLKKEHPNCSFGYLLPGEHSVKDYNFPLTLNKPVPASTEKKLSYFLDSLDPLHKDRLILRAKKNMASALEKKRALKNKQQRKEVHSALRDLVKKHGSAIVREMAQELLL